MTETIQLLVTVKIDYPNESTKTKTNKNRAEAVKIAKQCVTSTSILGGISVNPKKAKETFGAFRK